MVSIDSSLTSLPSTFRPLFLIPPRLAPGFLLFSRNVLYPSPLPSSLVLLPPAAPGAKTRSTSPPPLGLASLLLRGPHLQLPFRLVHSVFCFSLSLILCVFFFFSFLHSILRISVCISHHPQPSCRLQAVRRRPRLFVYIRTHIGARNPRRIVLHSSVAAVASYSKKGSLSVTGKQMVNTPLR